jgi:hypothetical protein
VAAAATLTGFEATIARAAEGFVGRDWLDRELDAFLRDEGRYEDAAPFLLLFGEPGVGKTAYAAHLVQERGWLHYFCSRLHPGWLDPGRFARNLGRQLYEHFGDDYARVLASQQHVEITAEQRVGTVEVGGQALNVYIENLVASDPVELFARLVADPLAALLSERPDETVTVVIDALDEARTYRGRVTILDLVAAALDLAPGVRTVATSRPDRQLQRLLAGAAVLDLKDFAADLKRDAAAYVGDRLRAPDVSSQLREAGVDTAELTRVVTERGMSNFLYLRLLFAGGAPLAVDEVPDGLGDVYTRSLDDLLATSGLEWRNDVRPVAGVLAVAREPLTFDQLERFSGLEATRAQDALAALEPLLDEEREGDSVRYAFFHGSLSDVLLARTANPSYWIEGPSFHLRIARSLVPVGGTWSDVDWPTADDYLLGHVARHLFLAGRDGFAELQALVDEGFRTAKNRRFLSDESFLLDLETAIEAAEQDGLAGLPRVVALSLGSAMLHARLTATPVGALVALARLGAESEALARLASVPPAAAVPGLIAIARDRHAGGRSEEAHSLLEQAARRAVSLQEDAARRESIGELLEALPLDGDRRSLDGVLEPLLFAIRELPDPAARIEALLQALTCLAKAGDQGAAHGLAEEALATLGAVDESGRLGALVLLARAFEGLGDEQSAAMLWDDSLAELRAAPEAAAQRNESLDVFGALGLVDEAVEFVRAFAPLRLEDIAEHLASANALDRAAELAAGLEDEDDRLALRAALAARRSDLGDPERALAELTAIEPELSPRGIGLAKRVLLRVEVALRLGGTDRERAKELLEQALAMMEEIRRREAEREHLSLLDDPTEEALLRVADAAGTVGDPRWARATVERTLDALLAAEPPAMFWYVEPLLWRARERASIAALLARLGAVERAKELFAQAAADAGAIEPETQAHALDLVAERLLAVPDPPWVEASVRSLLSSPAMLPGLGEAGIYLALAREGDLAEARRAVRAIIERHVASPDYDLIFAFEGFAELAAGVKANEALDWSAAAGRAAWATDEPELRDRLLRAMLLARLSAGAPPEDAVQELEAPQRALAYSTLAALLGEREDEAGAVSALERALEAGADAAGILAAIPGDAPAETVDRFLREAWGRIGEAVSDAADTRRRKALADGLAAEEAIGALPEAERAEASRAALLGLAGEMTPDQEVEAIIALLDELERDGAAAPLVADVARLGLVEHVEDAASWLLAAEAWASLVARLVETAGWADGSPEFESQRGEILAAAFRAVGDVAAGFAEAGDRENAERLAAQVESGAGRAYVIARLAGVIHEQGEHADAAGLVDTAFDALLSDPGAYWPDAYMDVAAGLARSGREADALELAAAVAYPAYRNDVIDAIARAVVVDAPDRAVAALEEVEEFDPWSLHASFTHAHFALEEAIDAFASRGDVERAAGLLERFDDDPWALAARPWALSAVADALAGLAASEPERVAAIAFDLLASVRSSRSDVLAYATGLAPVLRAAGDDLPAAAWRELKAVPGWAGSPEPSPIGADSA